MATTMQVDDALLKKSRAEAYRSQVKVGNKLQPALCMASLLALASFFATPAGVWCIVSALGFCSGFAAPEYVRMNPFRSFCIASVLTACWSITTFVPFAMYYDKLYRSCGSSGHCQPKKAHDTTGLARREVREAVVALFMAAMLSSAVVVSHLTVKFDRMYTDVAEWGWPWFMASLVVYFLWIDCWAYFGHRALHLSFLYKSYHKLHHAYKQPTAFVALAIHPVDMLLLQGGVYVGLFVFPLHVGCIAINLLYIHYFNVVDHSGIYAESWLPWQPSSLYHDDHHQFFHINYGQSLTLWDRLAGTFLPDRPRASHNALKAKAPATWSKGSIT